MGKRKARPRWWTYARNMIYVYPELHEKLEEKKKVSITASYTGMPHGSGVSNPTEAAAMRELSTVEQREHDAVQQAIEATKLKKNGEQALGIICLVYWTKSKTVDGAGAAVGYSQAQARRIHEEFVYTVARFYGMLDGVLEER